MSDGPSRRILVTAALGNVGRQVARECSERGLIVRAADLDERSLAARFPEREVRRLDFLDRATWSAALEGCDGVFLLRPPPIGDMDATLNPFATAAYEGGVQHIVFLSVAGADRMKWIPHRKVELHLATLGDRWTVLQPGFFAQNLEDAYRRDIVEDDRLYVPAADGKIAFVDLRDVGAVAARVFEHPDTFRRRVLTLTGPTPIRFDDVAAELTRALGRTIRYEPASLLGYVRHLRRRRLKWMQVVVQTILHAGLRRGDAEAVDPTIAEILGRPPRALAEYVADHAELWAQRAS